jgi:KTSC domain
MDPVNKTITQSSLIRAVAFDEARATLQIEFHNGEVYQYSNIPIELYNGLIVADSIGSYFNSKIRRNDLYPCRRIA